jgi:hypothetical protein
VAHAASCSPGLARAAWGPERLGGLHFPSSWLLLEGEQDPARLRRRSAADVLGERPVHDRCRLAALHAGSYFSRVLFFRPVCAECFCKLCSGIGLQLLAAIRFVSVSIRPVRLIPINQSRVIRSRNGKPTTAAKHCNWSEGELAGAQAGAVEGRVRGGETEGSRCWGARGWPRAVERRGGGGQGHCRVAGGVLGFWGFKVLGFWGF